MPEIHPLKIALVSLSLISVGVGFYYQRKNYQEQLKKLNNTQRFQTLKYILVGPPGVGKTKLFKKIVNYLKNSKQIDQGIEECQIRQDIDLVHTPALNFENIDQREIHIPILQQYMQKNHIAHFFFLVNFERTDLMKKKILELYKYFKKYKEIITIVITDFQLSDNEEEDKQKLTQALDLYLNSNKSIMFVKKNFDVEEFRTQLLIEAQAFSLDDTIFEPMSEEEQNQLFKEVNNKLTHNLQVIKDHHLIPMNGQQKVVKNQP